MEPTKTTAIVEAMLLAADEPLSGRKLKNLLPEVDPEEVEAAVAALRDEYSGPENRHGIELVELAGGLRFRTRGDLAPWLGRMFQQSPLRLSRAMLEVLAIVAYRQPLSRAEIDAVRGVDSSGSVRSLLERDLLRIVGRRDMPGRPQLYGTTKSFLEVFGLKNLRDLPPLEEELSELQQKLPLSELGLDVVLDDGDEAADVERPAAEDAAASDDSPIDAGPVAPRVPSADLAPDPRDEPDDVG